MSTLPTSPSKLRVGCVGGGQLGRMMALEAPRLNIDMKFLDGSGGLCPSAQVVGVTGSSSSDGGDNSTTKVVRGQLYDETKLRELSKDCNVVTMEIEHVGVDGLAKLESEGVNVQPSSRVIGIIQDKFVQKVCCYYYLGEMLCFTMLYDGWFILQYLKIIYSVYPHVYINWLQMIPGILLQTQHSSSTLH